MLTCEIVAPRADSGVDASPVPDYGCRAMDILEVLRDHDALRDGDSGGDVVSSKSLDRIPPTYADGAVISQLDRAVADGLRGAGITELYQHQADAIAKARQGHNVVLQAPTASGKSLAFQIAMLETLLSDNTAHALMIYPNKALALDQRAQLNQLVRHMHGRRIESWWYDGDTDRETRNLLRQSPPPILITNPEMINLSFLGHFDQWHPFLSKLKWLIVDEMHEYRGYFGSNAALLFRRLVHHLRSLSAHPRLFFSSATCANAKEHAENLTGLTFTEVNASHGFRPRRDYHFIQPDIPNHRYWEILKLRTVNAGLGCVTMGHSVLAFCPTRKFAEDCLRVARRQIENEEFQIDPDVVKVFRAGLSAEMRREVQDGLRDGSVKLVFSTNALELGVDIGGLDGVILAGFPDSMMSAWQRIGRAGRRWDSLAFVIYYARNNPLDRFYASNLDTFLGKPFDDLVVNPNNDDLVTKHVPALLYETPALDEGAQEILGPGLYQAARQKLQSGAVPVQRGRYIPHPRINLRGGGGGAFVLKVGAEEVGSLSAEQQFREAFLNAVYMHGGSTYRVAEVTQTGSGGEVQLVRVDDYLRTDPVLFRTLQQQDIYDGTRWEARGVSISAYYGKVLSTEVLSAVNEVDERTGNTVHSWSPQANEARFDNAHAFWLAVPDTTSGETEGVRELQYIVRIGALFTIPADAHDFFPYAAVRERTAYMVESYPGGIGIARKALERWRRMVEVGMRVAEECTCKTGCPNCIVPPRSSEELDKSSGIALATLLLETTASPPTFRFAGGLWEPAGIDG